MPESRRRRKDDYVPPKAKPAKDPTISSRWVAPLMVALLLLGLAWIIVYYLVGDEIPVMEDIGGWNLLIGMGLVTGGFITATKWK
jgi:hypothetical protein